MFLELRRTLQIDDSGEDCNGSEQVHHVGQVLPVESLAQSELLVWPSDEQVNQSNDGTLELGTTTGVDGGRGERSYRTGIDTG